MSENIVPSGRHDDVIFAVVQASVSTAGPLTRVPYAFEVQAQRLPTVAAMKELPKLKKNLFLGADDSRFDALLTEFIIEHHLRIQWYSARIRKEQRWRIAYIVFSGLLLLAIPLGSIAITSRLEGDAADALGVVSAALTGVLAFHNSLRSLFEKRNLVSVFHKAASSLKKQVFELEQSWSGKISSPSAVEGAEESEHVGEDERFVLALRDANRRAGDIEDEEKSAYFEITGFVPSVDVRSLLLDAGQGAAAIIGQHGGRRRLEAQFLRERVHALRAQLAMLESDAVHASPNDKLAIAGERDRVHAELREAEKQLREIAMKLFD